MLRSIVYFIGLVALGHFACTAVAQPRAPQPRDLRGRFVSEPSGALAPTPEGSREVRAHSREIVLETESLFRGRVTVRTIDRLASRITAHVDSHGRATPALHHALREIDRSHGDAFAGDRRVVRRFQGLLGRLGVRTHRAIEVPENRTPYWLEGQQPLANFQSRPELPRQVDVLIVGAGLTGTATAYHLVDAIRSRGLRVAVLDSGDPANQASGRNGGNFELMPENFFGIYQGLREERFKALRETDPNGDPTAQRATAERHARAILSVTARNRRRFAEIVEVENIDCDFSPRGWLRIAETPEEEQGIIADAALARELGLPAEVWSPNRIRDEKGIPARFSGRWTPDGNYNPFRYVTGLLQRSIEHGVELYTRTAVRSVRRGSGSEQIVETDRGVIRAGTVVFATNAFTSEVLPELRAIEPFQSQIMVTEHAPVTYQGLVTMRQGDLYSHYRDDRNRYPDPELAARTDGRVTHRAPFLQGGGLDRPFENPHRPRISRRVHETMLADRDQVAPNLQGQPPSRAWTGPMAFTRDRVPAIGFLRPGIVVAAGFNGYGGSYTTAAGMAAAEMALTGETPDWLPQDVFSPRRLTGGI